MTDRTLTGRSADIAAENIKKLKALFPEVFCEGAVDFDKLKAVLGEAADDSGDRYNFTWWGKSRALRLSQTPSAGTLRPCPEESRDWDATGNVYIEGDNLEVLKLLQKAYHGKIKMIYIDPPYNTGNDFVYPDDYRDNLQNYLQMTRQVDEEGGRISTNSEAGGRYHTNWLNMMYPRLRLARNLLREDGVIFISIDDTEVHNLRKISDEIFGEENFIASCVWQKRTSPDARNKLSTGHEYIIIYAKKIDQLEVVISLLPLSESDRNLYKNPDNDPRGPWVSSDFTAQGFRPNQMYKIVTPSGKEYVPPKGTCWKNVEGVYLQQAADGRFWYGKDGCGIPRRKTYLDEREGKNLWTWWPNTEVGHTQEGTQEHKTLFQTGASVFDFPKPVRLLYRIVAISTKDSDIILDFFSGSATTAHAVMQLNAEEGGNRKFIMVQLPEPCDEKSEACKAGYANICEIGKERIRRAGDKIKAELREKQAGQQSMLNVSQADPDKLDVGFKVFKLAASNLKKWNPDYDHLERTLEDMIDPYVPGRSPSDMAYEIMLKYGIDLTAPIEERPVAGSAVYMVRAGDGYLIICLDDVITSEAAGGIVALKKELGPEKKIRVVMKDSGFQKDEVKTNVKEILRNAGIDEFVTV